MKVSELEGALLDYWVAKAEGFGAELCSDDRGAFCVRTKRYGEGGNYRGPFFPSTEWVDGGPIIERSHISVVTTEDCISTKWCAEVAGKSAQLGPTALVAAMRAYVACKFGNEVTEVAHG